MKVAVFSPVPYTAPEVPTPTPPTPGEQYNIGIGQRSTNQALELMETADALGFDWVTVAEHHYSPFSLTPNPMLFAAAVSQRVKRAKIAVLGATIPILNPVRVAEEYAMLDTLSGGRVVAGLLRGSPQEYPTYSTNPGESRDRFQEGLELILRAWTEPQPFGWEGRYYQYRTVSIWPRPVQQPHPPVFMSGSSPESAEFAAQRKVSLGFAVTTVPLAAQSAKRYREVAEQTGWEPTNDNLLYRAPVYVGETDDEALDVARDYFARRVLGDAPGTIDAAVALGYFGRDVANQTGRRAMRSIEERMELGSIFCGSPDTVVKQLRRVHDEVGAGTVDLIFQSNALPHKMAARSLERFGTEVLPRVQEF